MNVQNTKPTVTTSRRVFKIDEELFNKIEDFKDQVMLAKANDDKWVETTRDIIDYFNPKGLGICPFRKKPNEHFTYEGLKVCEVGNSERIEEELTKDLSMFPIGHKITVDGR